MDKPKYVPPKNLKYFYDLNGFKCSVANETTPIFASYEVASVHTLQNLIFALTGKDTELTLKEKQ